MGQLQPVVLGFWGSPIPWVYCVCLTSCLPLPACPGVGPGRWVHRSCWGWEMCLQDLGLLLHRCWAGSIPHPRPHSALFSPKSCATFGINRKQTRSSSALGVWGQCPSVLTVQIPGTVWLQPIGTQRENLYWLDRRISRWTRMRAWKEDRP